MTVMNLALKRASVIIGAVALATALSFQAGGQRPNSPCQDRQACPSMSLSPSLAVPDLTSAPAVEVSPFVKATGTQLILEGNPYRFVGVNFYNANSRKNCWYPLGYSNNALATALSYIPSADVFRAWFYQGLALTNGVRDWSAFDHTLAVADQYGKKVVVQLSGEGGDCGDYPRDQHKTAAWYSRGYKVAPNIRGFVSYRDWVREFVTRYAGNRSILIYELVGEAEAPTDQRGTCSESGAAATLRSFADDIGRMVKSIDRNHLLTLGVIGTGQCGASGAHYTLVHASPYLDVCTTEDHGKPTEPMPGDSSNGMQTRLTQCGSLNKPVFAQESAIKLRAEAGGSKPARARLFAVKLDAQFAAGVVGELLWDYVAPHDPIYGGGDASGDDLMPGDPSLKLLANY